MQSKLRPDAPTCSLCSHKTEKVIFGGIIKNKISYDVFECLSCQTWITHPMPSAEELSITYSTGNYRAKTGKRFNPVLESIIHYLTIRKRERIKKYVRNGKILDIGCGRGLFLDIMQKDDWSVKGYEFDEKSASYARENYGIDVHFGNLYNRFEDETFDVVNINHVLEHLEAPDAVLSECHRILKKGGLLVVAVPNINSLQAKFGKSNWFQLDLPCHLYHFSTRGLTALIKKKMFLINQVRHFKLEYNPFGWLQTMLNVSGVPENNFYDLLKSSELRKRNKSGLSFKDKIKSILLIPFLIPFSLIMSVIEAMGGRGGTIEVYSQKK